MRNNVVELYHYREHEPFDYHGFNHRARVRFRNAQIRCWISTFLDAAATIAITGCTVFCCYLALTML